MKLRILEWILLGLVALVILGAVIHDIRQERAYARLRHQCEAAAPSGVDPVAWCEP